MVNVWEQYLQRKRILSLSSISMTDFTFSPFVTHLKFGHLKIPMIASGNW